MHDTHTHTHTYVYMYISMCIHCERDIQLRMQYNFGIRPNWEGEILAGKMLRNCIFAINIVISPSNECQGHFSICFLYAI